jgi:serine/threonine protein kinase
MTTFSAATSQEPTTPQRGTPAGATGQILHETYTLGPRIGQGGMGDVYEAAHVRLPGRFAVKVLRPDLLGNQEAVKRFCREAEIMSELRHPHIIQIFDFNTSSDGLPYFVMEFLDGVDLQTRLTRDGALPLLAAVRIVDAIASALGAAHAMGVVHRDLKPANIFLIRGERQDDEFVKVIDFGISKISSRGPSLSIPSGLIGTPAFMAPEQALGMVDQVDPRSDQFALAEIGYLMLTGREPFVGNDPASLLYQVVHSQPPALSHFLSWDVSQIQAVLDRGMAKRPEDRFESIAAFASAFSSAADALIGHPAPPSVEPVRAEAPVAPPLRLVPSPAPPSSLDEEDPPPPIKLPLVRPQPVLRSVEALSESELPRTVDRVPHGPQRAVALGLVVLALAGVIVHKDWYRGFPQHAARLQQVVQQAYGGLAHRGWRTAPSSPPMPVPETTNSASPVVAN